MVLWLIFAVLTAASLIAVLWPVWRERGQDAERGAYDSAIYRDQLTEIDSDLERGLIGEREAEAAKTEISRRLLEAAAPDGGDAEQTGTSARSSVPMAALACAVVCIPLASLVLYLVHGSPNLPGQPLAARLEVPPESQTLASLVARVEARLRDYPEDGQGWDAIAPVYLRYRRYDDAADAYGRALRLLGETPARLSGYAEALVGANNGIVNEEARRAFEKVLAQDPARPKARFWLATALEQDGRFDEAVRAWREMLSRGGADAPWRRLVEQRLHVAEARRDGREVVAAVPDAAAGSEDAPGPSAADIEAARQMTPEQRSAMINQMVDGLAERLKSDGKNLQGWLRLVRAYSVLGRRDAAREALSTARQNLAEDPAALSELKALAGQLGL